MARGIVLQDQWYEVDRLNADNSRTLIARMLIRMDKFNIGTANSTIKVSKLDQLPTIPAHISLDIGEREFGVHPRYIVGELLLSPIESKCYGIRPKRIVNIPVLTLEQFNKFKVFIKGETGSQPDTSIQVNHSRDGSVKLTYKIIAKHDGYLI